MAKNFPYFKFIATEWLTGDIVYEDFDTQGLFINICALYWQRDGKLSIEDINRRYKNEKVIQILSGRFFSVNDGFISISFLDEQLVDANHISKVNSENGKKGAEKRKQLATVKRTLSEPKANFSKEEEEEEEKKTKKFDFKKSCIDFGFKSELVIDWLNVRKNKKLTNTETAFNKFINQIKINGQDKNLILEKCIEKSWGGFESDWFKNQNIINKIDNPHGLSIAQLESNRIAAINIQEAIKQKAIDKELDRQDELRRKQQTQ